MLCMLQESHAQLDLQLSLTAVIEMQYLAVLFAIAYTIVQMRPELVCPEQHNCDKHCLIIQLGLL